ncbi:insulin-like growth factor-binding protein 1 isoform X2 [Varanus komodoensis]|uniref:insulin-like growth factor-binding protein 1 isoform X2 n=1 Tax=Varanus komodoensis TaxID=61221 RepID=UPI001CF7871A|nr:insulin-like growth factor-binding protein 1 isoform X2 [Varanus komodoensis]
MHPTSLFCELLLFLLSPGLVVGAALHAMHCAPCTEEKLALCPPVPAGCLETAQQAGCSCCHTCALQLGESCGVYTARCGHGLSCQVHPGEGRPLYALTHGQGTCQPTADTTETSESMEPEGIPSEDAENNADQLFHYQLMLPEDQDKSVPWNEISASESMKTKELAELKKWKEQCESSLDGNPARCWCVYPKNGKRIPGSLEMIGDPECEQYLSSQE